MFTVQPVPSHQTRALRALVVEMLSRWTPEGHCGCLVTQMYRPIRTIKTPHQNSKFMPSPSQPYPQFTSETPHTNQFFCISPPQSQSPGVAHHPVTPGDPARTQKPPKNPLKKQPFSWACFQVINIQLHTFQISTQIIFSTSVHPILNPWGWSSTRDQRGPPKPKNNSKYLQKTCFLSLFSSY